MFRYALIAILCIGLTYLFYWVGGPNLVNYLITAWNVPAPVCWGAVLTSFGVLLSASRI